MKTIIESGQFLKGPKINLGGIPFHEIILADAGFAVNEYTLTPFDLSDVTYALDPKQVNYNRRLSRCRVRVENAIGLLKNRFTMLKRKNHYGVEKMGDIFLACCVLHNFILMNGDPSEFHEETVEPEPRL